MLRRVAWCLVDDVSRSSHCFETPEIKQPMKQSWHFPQNEDLNCTAVKVYKTRKTVLHHVLALHFGAA
jgi:hypothetical protein